MKLGKQAIESKLKTIPKWRRFDDKLRRSFVFADFSEAFAFMTRVAFVAEKMGHHPEWKNVWNRVAIEITTHDAGGLTTKDFTFALAIDRLGSR